MASLLVSLTSELLHSIIQRDFAKTHIHPHQDPLGPWPVSPSWGRSLRVTWGPGVLTFPPSPGGCSAMRGTRWHRVSLHRPLEETKWEQGTSALVSGPPHFPWASSGIHLFPETGLIPDHWSPIVGLDEHKLGPQIPRLNNWASLFPHRHQNVCRLEEVPCGPGLEVQPHYLTTGLSGSRRWWRPGGGWGTPQANPVPHKQVQECASSACNHLESSLCRPDSSSPTRLCMPEYFFTLEILRCFSVTISVWDLHKYCFPLSLVFA